MSIQIQKIFMKIPCLLWNIETRKTSPQKQNKTKALVFNEICNLWQQTFRIVPGLLWKNKARNTSPQKSQKKTKELILNEICLFFKNNILFSFWLLSSIKIQISIGFCTQLSMISKFVLHSQLQSDMNRQITPDV